MRLEFIPNERKRMQQDLFLNGNGTIDSPLIAVNDRVGNIIEYGGYDLVWVDPSGRIVCAGSGSRPVSTEPTPPEEPPPMRDRGKDKL